MSAPAAADAAAFRRLMGRWATGVSIVTAREGDRDFGLTVNAFLSVSLTPPTLLVSLGHEADTTPVVARTGRFTVSVLAHDQRSLSEKFARTSTPEVKFQGTAIHRTPSGLAVVDGALATFDVKVTKSVELADHTLFAGVVERLDAGPEAAPLLFFRSQYAEPAGADLVRLPKPKP